MKNSTNTTNNQFLSRRTTIKTVFLEIDSTETNKEYLLKDISEQIVKNKKFELGAYSSMQRFKNDLHRKIFGDSEDANLPDLNTQTSMISKIITDSITLCYKYMPVKGDINIFVLPMKNIKASIDLDGVNAFALGRGTLFILINPTIKDWDLSLKNTIPHEYAHLVSAHYVEFQSIRTGMVYEGLAEHLREFLFGGAPAKYSIALEKEKAISELLTLSDTDLDCFINDTNYDFYLSYFYGTGSLPKWYGYSLGYWLIGSILEKTGIPLKKLFKIQSKEIFTIFKTL